jgi:transcriptional regulator with XRE-family HTH domain
MDLATYRKSRDLTQEACATALGLSPSSKGWISEIESGQRAASLRLALKIEDWSGGKVTAASLSPIAAQLAQERAA